MNLDDIPSVRARGRRRWRWGGARRRMEMRDVGRGMRCRMWWDDATYDMACKWVPKAAAASRSLTPSHVTCIHRCQSERSTTGTCCLMHRDDDRDAAAASQHRYRMVPCLMSIWHAVMCVQVSAHVPTRTRFLPKPRTPIKVVSLVSCAAPLVRQAHAWLWRCTPSSDR